MNQTKLFSFTRFLAITLPLLAVVSVSGFLKPNVVLAADVCSLNPDTLILKEVNQQVTNNPDSGNAGKGDWALDTYIRNIKVWESTTTPGTFCGQTKDTGTFVTNGTFSPESGSPLPGAVTGTIVGGMTYVITGATSTTPTLSDSSWVLGQRYSEWVNQYFGSSAVSTIADWGWVYTSTLGEVWTNAQISTTGDIHAVANLTTHIGYATIQDAVNAATSSDTIALATDATTTAQITIKDKAVTIDGRGHTLRAAFPKTGDANNSAIGVQHAGVTIKNLTVDGTGGQSYPLQLHGINVYVATSTMLDSVNVINFGGSGIVVNGSEVTATNLNTSGNKWNSVNVDPGSGVTTPSVFTLTSGTLADANQIWSDGKYVTATATVNALLPVGYNKYAVGAKGTLWTNSLKNAATITKNGVTTLYKTIIEAVKAAQDGDTVKVYPGDYNLVKDDVTMIAGQAGWYLPIEKNNITLQGVDTNGQDITTPSAVATNIYSTQETANGNWSTQDLIAVFGDNVTIRGLGIMNKIAPNKAIEVMGNNFKAEFNKFMPVPKSLFANADNYLGDDITKYGSGVYLNSTSTTTPKTATIVNNTFNNSGITFDSFGSNWTVNITGNTFDGNKIWISAGTPTYYSSIGATTSTTPPQLDFTGSALNIHNNKFINMVAGKLIVKARPTMAGIFDATNNWWGTASSTEIAAMVSSHVNYTPWCARESCVPFADVTALTAAKNAAQALITANAPESTTPNHHVVGSLAALSTALAAATATTEDTQTIVDAQVAALNAAITAYNTAIVPQPTPAPITNGGGGGGYSGGSGGGVVVPPPARMQRVYPDGRVVYLDTPAVENHASNGARPFAGGQVLGVSTFNFTRDLGLGSRGDDVTELQKRLISESFLAGVPTGYFGKVTRDGVKKFQIKNHLPATGFVGAKTRAVLNGTAAGGFVLPPTANATSTSAATSSPRFNFTLTHGLGSRGGDVLELQKRLIGEGFLSTDATGYYGKITSEAVKKFQVKYGIPATGLVGPMTRAALNK